MIAYLAPGHYSGVDSRAEIIDEAFKELKSARLEAKRPTLLATTSLSSVVLPNRVDVVWAFSVLIHMDDAALDDCLRLVVSVLTKDGTLT